MRSLKSLLELSVWLNDEFVGTIIRLAGDKHWFAFDENYLNKKNRPTLSLSFKNRDNALMSNTRMIQTRVPPFFSNLLPEGHLRDYLATQLSIKSAREFFLLAALGADLPGAIKIFPVDFDPLHPDFQTIQTAPTNKTQDPLLRFSLAGVQLKFSAIAEAKGGLTIPIDGMGGSWIVKLPSMRFHHIPENEFVMLELARAIGIPVPATQLMSVNDIHGLPEEVASLEGKAFIIQRFDRMANQRVHMEDFAQVFGLFPEKKYEQHNYENIAQVLLSETHENNMMDFFRRLIFSILIGNGDMHLKNWSLLYPDGVTPELSPAYDFVSTIPYLSHDHLALNFGGSKDLHTLSRTQIRRFANAVNMPFYPLQKLAQETIDLTLETWKNLPSQSLLPLDMKRAIEKQMNQVALSFTQ